MVEVGERRIAQYGVAKVTWGERLEVAEVLLPDRVGRFIEENIGSWFPYFRVPLDVALLALGMTALLAALAAAVPAWQAANLKVIDALRRLG